jgi:hypothetical protein
MSLRFAFLVLALATGSLLPLRAQQTFADPVYSRIVLQF